MVRRAREEGTPLSKPAPDTAVPRPPPPPGPPPTPPAAFLAQPTAPRLLRTLPALADGVTGAGRAARRAHACSGPFSCGVQR